MNGEHNSREILTSNEMTTVTRDRLEMSIDLLDAVLCVDPIDKLALLARGSLHLKLGNVKRASNDFSRVLKMDPNHTKACYLRGLSREMVGEVHQAMEDFNHVIDIDPEYKAAYHSRASLLTKMGQGTKAAEDIKAAAQLTE